MENEQEVDKGASQREETEVKTDRGHVKRRRLQTNITSFFGRGTEAAIRVS